MSYYTYSEGFRPGGFNRTATTLDGSQVFLTAEAPFNADGSAKQFYKPAGFSSDQLINQEVGIKSEWLDHRLLFNVSGYVMHWSNVQLSLFDPVHLGNTTFDINGPEYKVKGFEVQFVARLFEGFTVEGSTSVNSTEQVNGPCLPVNRAGAPSPQGACVTQVNGLPYTNPYGVNGTRPPFSPPWMFNARARYDWTAGTYKPYAWFGASHTGPMSNEPASFRGPRGRLSKAAGGHQAGVGQALDQFMKAVDMGDSKAAAALLDKGVDPDSADARGNTALMIASLQGHRELVALEDEELVLLSAQV
jgi:outer membrane receptor protein involved in Fe transport